MIQSEHITRLREILDRWKYYGELPKREEVETVVNDLDSEIDNLIDESGSLQSDADDEVSRLEDERDRLEDTVNELREKIAELETKPRRKKKNPLEGLRPEQARRLIKAVK